MATPVVPDLRGVELVPADTGLIDHTGEVAVQRGHRVSARQEPLKLRMVYVAVVPVHPRWKRYGKLAMSYQIPTYRSISTRGTVRSSGRPRRAVVVLAQPPIASEPSSSVASLLMVRASFTSSPARLKLDG
jgi:hypothetical protein